MTTDKQGDRLYYSHQGETVLIEQMLNLEKELDIDEVTEMVSINTGRYYSTVMCLSRAAFDKLVAVPGSKTKFSIISLVFGRQFHPGKYSNWEVENFKAHLPLMAVFNFFFTFDREVLNFVSKILEASFDAATTSSRDVICKFEKSEQGDMLDTIIKFSQDTARYWFKLIVNEVFGWKHYRSILDLFKNIYKIDYAFKVIDNTDIDAIEYTPTGTISEKENYAFVLRQKKDMLFTERFMNALVDDAEKIDTLVSYYLNASTVVPLFSGCVLGFSQFARQHFSMEYIAEVHIYLAETFSGVKNLEFQMVSLLMKLKASSNCVYHISTTGGNPIDSSIVVAWLFTQLVYSFGSRMFYEDKGGFNMRLDYQEDLDEMGNLNKTQKECIEQFIHIISDAMGYLGYIRESIEAMFPAINRTISLDNLRV